MDLFNWGRALDIAVKYRTHIDTVLAYRSKHLQSCGKVEGDKKFLQYANEVFVTIKHRMSIIVSFRWLILIGRRFQNGSRRSWQMKRIGAAAEVVENNLLASFCF